MKPFTSEPGAAIVTADRIWVLAHEFTLIPAPAARVMSD
jgi:hypothetical protein